jgi:vitamin K-dependent gamma-carboxylase
MTGRAPTVGSPGTGSRHSPSPESPPTGSGLRRVRMAAGVMVPGHSVAVARMAFGAVVTISAARVLARGWVDDLWAQPEVLLGWPGLGVPLLPRPGLIAVVAGVGTCGAMIAAGVATRGAALAFLVGFGYLELLDRTTYLNHYWAMTLLAVLLVLLPTDGTWSLAARRHGATRGVPAWTLWLLRGQIAIVYLFAAIAKLHPDWLLRGEPLATWMAARTDLPVLGPLLAVPVTALLASWAGLLFDLTIVVWLWWRATRPIAIVGVVAFHTVTWLLFPAIGVFPLLMVWLATVWLPPDWPVRVRRRAGVPVAAPAGRCRAVTVAPTVLAGVAVWTLLQIVLPLRHLAIPGDVRWTEEAGRFSWRVMAEEKVGWARFQLTDPVTGTTDTVNITDVLTPNQAHVAALRPDLLHQVSSILADRRAADTGVRPQVRVDAWVSWNGRPHARLIDPAVDLAAMPWRHGRHQSWILEPPA